MADTDERVSRRGEFSRKHVRPAANRITENSDRLWYTLWSFAKNATSRYMNYNHPIGVSEIDLHDLWYYLIQIAKVTPADEADSDRIVAQVVRIREIGNLSRPVTSDDATPRNADNPAMADQVAITSSGAYMWTDLPFLVADMRAAWTTSLYKMTATERDNLSGITARLSASNVCGEQMTSCALILLRAALETPRPTLSPDEALTAGQPRPEISFQELFQSVFVWLYWGSCPIWRLCMQKEPFQVDAGLSAMDGQWADVGQLAVSRGMTEPGFNPTRMQFWKQRLQEVADEVQETDAKLADKCKWCSNLLGQWDSIIGRSSGTEQGA